MEKLVFCVFVLIAVTQAWESEKHKYEGAPLGPKGEVIDTPEVAHAKEEHFEKVKEALHHDYPEHKYEEKHDDKYYPHKTYDKHEEYYPHHDEIKYRTEDHGNFYNVKGHFELVHGKYLPNTKEVEIAAEKHIDMFHKIKHEREH